MIYWVMAFLAGVALPFQVGLNNMVAKVSSPLWATTLSFIIGMVTIMALVAASRNPVPSLQTLSQLPAYVWLGGVLGTFYVATSIFVAPKIGAVMLMGLLLAGQLLTAVVIDHFGAIGFPKVEISPGRILGCLLIIAGCIAIKKF